MKKNLFVRLMTLVLVFCMLVPVAAMATTTYYLEVSIEEKQDSTKKVQSKSVGYLLEDEPLVPLVVTSINERYADGSLEETFRSPAMRRIMDEGLAAYKRTVQNGTDDWKTYVAKYYEDVKNHDADKDLKKILSNLDSKLGDLELNEVYRMEFKNDVAGDRRYGTIYVVSVVRRAYGAPIFEDVSEDKYYYDAVVWAVENGITNGVTATTFNPNGPCTRAQTVTFLWRAAGCPEPKTTVNPFTDVIEGKYYYKAVLWAVENGITLGTTETTFSPNDPCTRGHVVTFLFRSVEGAEATGTNPFTDVAEGKYFYEPVLWAVENGITLGNTATTFNPYGTCTRAQIVTFLYRHFAG